MKILAIGDFHGKFPAKLKKLAKEVDLVISIGDYFPFSYRKLWFKHCYGKDIELWEVIGKRKLKELVLKDLASRERVLKELNKLNIPVISIIGNVDYANVNDQYSSENWTRKGRWDWYEQDFFSKMIKKYKNILRFDYSYALVDDLVFIGGFGHTSPGQVKSPAYKRYKAKLDKLFKRFRKENGKREVIFVTHNMPNKTKFDKLKVKGKTEHYGSIMVRKIIDKYKPILAIGGHMHENWGKCKVGKTLLINPGAAVDGRAALIDFDVKKGKVKSVKFVK